MGKWWAAVPSEEWPKDPATRDAVLKDWKEPFGDRQNMIVFIGQDVDEKKLKAALSHALLTSEESALSRELWKNFSDPFPAWSTHEVEGELALTA